MKNQYFILKTQKTNIKEMTDIQILKIAQSSKKELFCILAFVIL